MEKTSREWRQEWGKTIDSLLKFGSDEEFRKLGTEAADGMAGLIEKMEHLPANSLPRVAKVGASAVHDYMEQRHNPPPAEVAYGAHYEPSEKRVQLLSTEKRFADAVRGSYPEEFEHVDAGRLLRGWLTGEWAGAELEQRAMTSSPTTAGGILVPTPLSARIIDVARNFSAVFKAGATTVPMESATLKVARATQDIASGWFSPNTDITESDMVFDSVTFTARKMACLVRVENELLEDAVGMADVVTNSIGQSIALELDRVCLLGTGTPPQPKGLYADTNVNSVAAFGAPADYTKFLTGYFNIVGYNFAPGAVIYNSRTAAKLAGLATGIASDKTQLGVPAPWDSVTKYVSNQIPSANLPGATDSAAFLGEWRYLWIGLRRNILLEVSREAADAFSKDQTFVRATWRGDVQIAQPKAFNKYVAIAP